MQLRYGRLLRILQICVDQTMSETLAKMELTAAQGHVIGFITHREQPPCAKDIEEAFQLSHPTVSGLLARLEKKGFIRLQPDAQDRRYKRIYLQPKGWQLHEMIHEAIEANERRLVQDFSAEEKKLFQALLLRAIDNMGQCPGRQKNEEAEA